MGTFQFPVYTVRVHIHILVLIQVYQLGSWVFGRQFLFRYLTLISSSSEFLVLIHLIFRCNKRCAALSPVQPRFGQNLAWKAKSPICLSLVCFSDCTTWYSYRSRVRATHNAVGSHMQEGNEPLLQKERAINTTDSTPILRCGDVTYATIHTCFMRTQCFLAPSSVKVNSSMNLTNRQGSTRGRGSREKETQGSSSFCCCCCC
jgi:hypothetical protein